MDLESELQQLTKWMQGDDLNGKGASWVGSRLCDYLCEIGIPIARGHCLALVLHPLYNGRSIIWTEEEGGSEANWAHGRQNESGWQDSVFRALIEGDGPDLLTFDLRDPSVGSAFPMLNELREQGMTGYIAFRLRFQMVRFMLRALRRVPPRASATSMFNLSTLSNV